MRRLERFLEWLGEDNRFESLLSLVILMTVFYIFFRFRS